MATREFQHYPGCNGRDPDNCGACALTDTRQSAPNYAAWPLVYMENYRVIPAKWRKAFIAEMKQTRNIPYAENIKRTLQKHGVLFSDGKGLES
jgi:hypothetical protein